MFHCQLFCINKRLLSENTLYLNSGPSHQNQERRAALTETALKNPVLFSGPRGGRFEKICCIGSTSNPSATVGPWGPRMRMSGSFPEDVHLLPHGGATCLWPVGMDVHGCSLALSSDRSGQGAYGGVSSPPSRDPQCADPSSHKHPQLSCLSPDGP